MKLRIYLLSLFISLHCYAYNVGLLIVATGKYIQFVEPFIKSAERYFCTNHQVTYFVFTDGEFPSTPHKVRIEQKKLGWPYDTMMRITMYYTHRDTLQDMDYLFAADADMLFVDDVGDEILSERVATQHPGYVGRRGTYEMRQQSTAYVAPHEGTCYFAGGFHGGSREEFLKMVRMLTENIYKDLAHNIIAIWHDESHINRYFITNPPTKILSPSYCMPGSDLLVEQWGLCAYPQKLLAIVKNHKEYRS